MVGEGKCPKPGSAQILSDRRASRRRTCARRQSCRTERTAGGSTAHAAGLPASVKKSVPEITHSLTISLKSYKNDLIYFFEYRDVKIFTAQSKGMRTLGGAAGAETEGSHTGRSVLRGYSARYKTFHSARYYQKIKKRRP